MLYFKKTYDTLKQPFAKFSKLDYQINFVHTRLFIINGLITNDFIIFECIDK